MTYLSAFKSGNLVIPSALLLHFKDIFDSSDDFLVWQFFYLQNTTSLEELAPSQIAEHWQDLVRSQSLHVPSDGERSPAV